MVVEVITAEDRSKEKQWNWISQKNGNLSHLSGTSFDLKKLSATMKIKMGATQQQQLTTDSVQK